MNHQYDKTDPKSIEAYSKKLVGKTLNNFLEENDKKRLLMLANKRNKGGFGQALEEHYFHIHPGNKQAPDFEEAGVELKTSPLKKDKKNKRTSKERLVLNNINYSKMAEETWEDSMFLKKNSLLLLIFYLYEHDKSIFDYLIDLASLWECPPESDMKIIKEDWLKIQKKIRDGEAHNISERDTLYLGACTKGATKIKSIGKQPCSEETAQKRALCLKYKYINTVYESLVKKQKFEREHGKILQEKDPDFHKKTFDEIVIDRFKPYLGKSIDEICSMLGLSKTDKPKDFYASVSRMMLGVKKRKIEEFEKADIVLKACRLNKEGVPAEHISFPAFDYQEIINEKWGKSELKMMFEEKRFLFVIFQYDKDNNLILKKVVFWKMPDEDFFEAERVWKETVKRIKEGKCDSLPKTSESDMLHVRPHAKNRTDTGLAPDGKYYIKKSFWLNAGYIKRQIEKIAL